MQFGVSFPLKHREMNNSRPPSIDGGVRDYSFFNKLHTKAVFYHGKTPGIAKLPFPVVAIILLLVFINLLVWAAAGILLHFHR